MNTQTKLVDEMLQWYKEFYFLQYQPAGLNLEPTACNSVLCVDSLGAWMEENGYKYGDPEPFERCAGLSADVAKYTAEKLNELLL